MLDRFQVAMGDRVSVATAPTDMAETLQAERRAPAECHQFLAIEADQGRIHDIFNLHDIGHLAGVATSSFVNLGAWPWPRAAKWRA
jgi:hypothetical protein